MSEFFIDRENTMTMRTVNEFKRHSGGAFLTVFHSARGTESALTAERNKFKMTTGGTGIQGTAKRRVTTMNHPVNVFDYVMIWM